MIARAARAILHEPLVLFLAAGAGLSSEPIASDLIRAQQERRRG